LYHALDKWIFLSTPPELSLSTNTLVGTLETIRENVRKSLGEEGSLIHGDFWTGNVLLPNAPLPPGNHPLKIYIIDWELSHLSSIAFDLGQMFAELFELKHFKDINAGVWLIESFMDGYGPVDVELAFRTAVHVGTHLICWGSRVVGWGEFRCVILSRFAHI